MFIASKGGEDVMKHHMISFKAFAPLAATAVLAAALSGAPAYAAQDKSDTSMQTTAGETAEDFTNWAQMHHLNVIGMSVSHPSNFHVIIDVIFLVLS